MAKLSIRIDFDNGFRLGPGKIALLERVAKFGSIAAAGRDMDMSYRRAWELINALNAQFTKAIVIPKSGGRKGGGAELTAEGLELVAHYTSVFIACEKAGRVQLRAIAKAARQKAKSVG
jgi:molybdate transport system regulatory protein